MRPSPDVTPSEPRYECLACGSRACSGGGRTCEVCGGALLNLGVERDL